MADQVSYVNAALTEVLSKELVFRTSRDDLSDAVAWTAKNLPSRPTVPVLNGLLLTGTENGLTVSAFDYEVSGRAQLNAEVSTQGGVLVSGNLLSNIAKSLPPNKPVEFTTDGTQAFLTCGRSKFTLRTMDIDTYPALPVLSDASGTVNAEVFIEAVGQVVTAASRDETNPMLTGVRMEVVGKQIKMVATDRFRMAVREFEWTPNEEDFSTELLVPAKTLAEVARAGADGIDMHLSLGAKGGGDDLFGITGDTKRNTTRLLPADFPEYQRLLPDSHTAVATVDVGELTEAIKRVSLMADRNQQVKLAFSEGVLLLSAAADDLGDAQEELDIDFVGEPLTIAFNPAYLADGLAALHAKRARFGFTAASRPAVLQAASDASQQSSDVNVFAAVDANFKYVLMPVRLA